MHVYRVVWIDTKLIDTAFVTNTQCVLCLVKGRLLIVICNWFGLRLGFLSCGSPYWSRKLNDFAFLSEYLFDLVVSSRSLTSKLMLGISQQKSPTTRRSNRKLNLGPHAQQSCLPPNLQIPRYRSHLSMHVWIDTKLIDTAFVTNIQCILCLVKGGLLIGLA